MGILKVECSGTPYEIGYTHGTNARLQISRTITFYATLFLSTSKRTWPEVLKTAETFDDEIQKKWPRYYEELKGIAAGSGRDLLDIIAINVRSEIAFGLFSDGCTSLYWKGREATYLGQNWDWQIAQKQNLILLTIKQPSLPTIKMVTEAGLIGKIGLNSSGVGVCFNAIRAKGLDTTRLPCHFGLRMALESTSAAAAVKALESWGMASSAHILIGDGQDATGLEFTSKTFYGLKPEEGVVMHSNHLIGEHEDVVEPKWLEDSPKRIERMGVLVGKMDEKADGFQGFQSLFEDEDGFPGSICRAQEGESEIATLFNIVMDLRGKRAVVRMGRPVESEEMIEISF